MDFKTFIISLLRRGNLNTKFCETLFTESEKHFETAFTHRTYNPIENYEYYEFIGDSVVNSCVAKYIVDWDSRIVSVKYLTRLKHNITSKKQLSYIAHNLGFIEHIRLGEGELKAKKSRGKLYYESIKKDPLLKDNLLEDETYRSWLEDCLEAFIGLVSLLIDAKSKNSISFSICYNIIKSFLNEIKISLRYEDVFDAKTRYKELCDRRWGYEVNIEGKKRGPCIKESERKDEEGRTWHKTTVIGYPFGDKTAKKENEKVLAVVEESCKMNSQHKACEKALKVLKELYSIWDFPPDPFKRVN